jgi:hypothetical protein
MKYPSVTAKIVDILVEDTDYGKQWAIMLLGEENGEDVYAKLTLMYNSKPATCFLCCIENADVTRPIEFTPKESKEIKDGKEIKSTSLFLNQDGHAIKWAHTKANMNGMPEPKQAVINGVKQWDNTDKLAFFEKIISEKVLPIIKGAAAESKSHDFVDHVDAKTESADDLPF